MEYGYNKNWYEQIRKSTDGRKDYDDFEERVIDEINKKYRHLPSDKFNLLITKVLFVIKQHKEQVKLITEDTSTLISKLKVEVDEHVKWINYAKTTFYTPLRLLNGFDYKEFEFARISDNTKENYPIPNFMKGFIDELLALPEVIMMLGDPASRDALFQGLKSLATPEGIMKFISMMGDVVEDLWSGDAYQKGRSLVFTGLSVLGIYGIAKGLGTAGARLATKIGKDGVKQTLKDGGRAVVKAPGKAVKAVAEIPGRVAKGSREFYEYAKTAKSIEDLKKLSFTVADFATTFYTLGANKVFKAIINKYKGMNLSELSVLDSKVLNNLIKLEKGINDPLNQKITSLEKMGNSTKPTVDKLKDIQTQLNSAITNGDVKTAQSLMKKAGEHGVKFEKDVQGALKQYGKDYGRLGTRELPEQSGPVESSRGPGLIEKRVQEIEVRKQKLDEQIKAKEKELKDLGPEDEMRHQVREELDQLKANKKNGVYVDENEASFVIKAHNIEDGRNTVDDEIRALDARRLDLNKQASQAGIAKEELDLINKEVNLIESRIRNSQNGLNGASDSAKAFEPSVLEQPTNSLPKFSDGTKYSGLDNNVQKIAKDGRIYEVSPGDKITVSGYSGRGIRTLDTDGNINTLDAGKNMTGEYLGVDKNGNIRLRMDNGDIKIVRADSYKIDDITPYNRFDFENIPTKPNVVEGGDDLLGIDGKNPLKIKEGDDLRLVPYKGKDMLDVDGNPILRDGELGDFQFVRVVKEGDDLLKQPGSKVKVGDIVVKREGKQIVIKRETAFIPKPELKGGRFFWPPIIAGAMLAGSLADRLADQSEKTGTGGVEVLPIIPPVIVEPPSQTGPTAPADKPTPAAKPVRPAAKPVEKPEQSADKPTPTSAEQASAQPVDKPTLTPAEQASAQPETQKLNKDDLLNSIFSKSTSENEFGIGNGGTFDASKFDLPKDLEYFGGNYRDDVNGKGGFYLRTKDYKKDYKLEFTIASDNSITAVMTETTGTDVGGGSDLFSAPKKVETKNYNVTFESGKYKLS